MATLGVHLVGSVCGVDTAEASFRNCAASFPSRLRRLPDGEPAHRGTFIGWQRDVFSHTPVVLKQFDETFAAIEQPEVPDDEIKRIAANMPPLKPGFLDAALESYEVFKKLKQEGIINSKTRFLVALPTPVAVMTLVRAHGFQTAIEPIYEAALLDELRQIQGKIPKSDLAIQWDFACEIAALEHAWPHYFTPYFEPYFEGATERLTRLLDFIDPEVEAGIHLCYGDIFNKHVTEPKDTGLLVRVANAVIVAKKRKLDFLHLPVPKERDDDAYFAPLKDLKLGDTELYLGLVHGYEEEKTKDRIKAAKKVVSTFGVATECGLGRTPAEKFESIAKISTEVSTAVV
ncbi:hypothetical protein CAC42_7012 [Sphaceloma murrayae]|uniref:Uncharacterized protein n=1 Tax=Sphaceloma murrayae TaxID=2082308 RepID=A0A2K1QQS6_9PEZI|nr:hypothetical protein CAC42_7012 [Sphaceloma murrayae]